MRFTPAPSRRIPSSLRALPVLILLASQAAYAARRFHQYGHSNYSNHADSNSNTHPNSHSDGNADFHPNPDTHTDT